ncbi:hypothetical protein [Brachybacterium phenoliresistens]|uniref:hypothetical protein n=1 Tax=Brachybacterium phenoliresistens TaxID=396014 RepID=UPI0031DAFF90
MSTTYPDIELTVYGTEFTRLLEATSLFHANPRDDDRNAVVRCFARHDGLTLTATNGTALGAGILTPHGQEGAGLFAITAAQVKAVLAVFKRRLPKDATADEYLLSIQVSEDQIRIVDRSDLFDHDELTLTIPPPEDGAYREAPDEQAMRIAAMLRRILHDQAPLDLADGCTMPHDRLTRLAKAARILGGDLALRPQGSVIVSPIGDTFVAVTVVQEVDRETHRAPFRDEVNVREWMRRVDDIAASGVL